MTLNPLAQAQTLRCYRAGRETGASPIAAIDIVLELAAYRFADLADMNGEVNGYALDEYRSARRYRDRVLARRMQSEAWQ
jgi:hypothetical protein